MRLICLQKAFFPAGPRKPTGGDRKRLAECACERFGIFPNASESSRTLRNLPERFGNFPNASETSRTLRNLRERFGIFANGSEAFRTHRNLPERAAIRTRRDFPHALKQLTALRSFLLRPHQPPCRIRGSGRGWRGGRTRTAGTGPPRFERESCFVFEPSGIAPKAKQSRQPTMSAR